VLGPIKAIYDISMVREAIVDVAKSTVTGKYISYNSYNHATATCEYYVNGVRYTLDVMGRSQFDVGQAVSVHYNASNPRLAYVGPPPTFQDTYLSLVVLVAFFVFGTIAVLAKHDSNDW
jgi:hypothetical protein